MFFFLVFDFILSHAGASIGLTLLVPRREKGRRRRDHVCDYAEERMISNPFYIQFQKGSSPMDGIDARLSVQTR